MNKESFNWEQYVNNYEDLKKAGINNIDNAWNHWINHGQYEGRHCQTNTIVIDDFDWEQYINNYSDLQNAGINTKLLALDHWTKYGMNENRTDKKLEFNLKINNYLVKLNEIKMNRSKPLMAIDCQPIQHEIRGIGRYCINLINIILEKNTEYNVVLIFNNFMNTDAFQENLNKINISKSQILTCNFDINKIDFLRKYNTSEYEEFKLEQTYANFLDDLYLDVYLNLSEFDLTKISFNKKLIKNKQLKSYCVVYDLIPLTFPEKFLTNSLHSKIYYKHFNNLKSYNNLLSISKFTEKVVKQHIKHIDTISTGVNFNVNKNLSNDEINKILNKYGITKKFIYMQSGFDYHKGFNFALEKFFKLNDDIKNNLQLVFGTIFNTNNVVSNLINIYNECINSNTLIITGRLSEEELSALHSASWLFIFPSEMEGFGLPIVEAWVHNKPAIVAKNSSMIEIMDDDRFMFNHDNSFGELITKLYYNNNFYNECVSKTIRKNMYTWDIVYNNFDKILNKPIISVVCLIKNNEDWIQYFDNYMSELENLNEYVFEYFFYENNSTDNSKQLINKFMKNRSGKYICENIKPYIKWSNSISIERGLWMTHLRQKLKKMHGLLNSDYVLIIDSDIILEKDSINKFVDTFKFNSDISVVSPYTNCLRANDINHYYDTLALFTLDNFNYITSSNTCPFIECNGCKNHRKSINIEIDKSKLFSSNNKIIDVYVAFGSCSMYPTKYYNICDYDEKILMEKLMVCEHYHFVEQFRKYGRVVINTDIKLQMK